MFQEAGLTLCSLSLITFELQLAIAVCILLQFSLLALVSRESTVMRALVVSAAALNAVSSLGMLALSDLEHRRSPRPSILLSSYRLITLLFDIVQLRTLWLDSTTSNELTTTRVLATTAVSLKAIILALESHHKTRRALSDPSLRSPEELTGPVGLGTYLWLNRLFLMGYRRILSTQDPFPLDSRMKSAPLEHHLASKLIKKRTTWTRQTYGLARVEVRNSASV